MLFIIIIIRLIPSHIEYQPSLVGGRNCRLTNLVNVFYNIGKQIDKLTNDKYYHLAFDFKNYHLDDFKLIPEICQDAENVDISKAILFIENNIIN